MFNILFNYEVCQRCGLFVFFCVFTKCFPGARHRGEAREDDPRRRSGGTCFATRAHTEGRRAATNLDRFSDTAARHQQCPDVGFVYSIELYLLKANTLQYPLPTLWPSHWSNSLSPLLTLTTTVTSQQSPSRADRSALRNHRVCQSQSRILHATRARNHARSGWRPSKAGSGGSGPRRGELQDNSLSCLSA